MNMRSILFGLCMIATIAGYAHGDEDHAAGAEKTGSGGEYFSAEKSSGKYEVLIKHTELSAGKEAHMDIYLSDVNSNKPIDKASLSLLNPDSKEQKFDITGKEPGIYEVHTEFGKNGSARLNVKIDGSLGADLLQVAGVEVGKSLGGAEAVADHGIHGWQVAVFVFIALIIGMAVGLFLNRRSQLGRKAGAAMLILLVQLLPVQNTLFAHGGEDHGETPSGSGTQGTLLTVPKETQFLFDVWTQKVGQNNFSPAVSLFGTVIPTSSGKAVVQSPFTGIIRNLKVNVGQQVGKGQLLAVIEQNVDAATQVSWATERNTLNAEVQAAKKELDRLKSIADIVAKREIDEAERRYQTALDNKAAFDRLYSGSKQNSKYISLYSPIAGKIENFNFSIGSTVSAGQDIFSITNLSKVYVEAQVFDKDVDFVNRGKEFIVECTNDDHKTRAVRLVTTAQSLNTTNQSQKVLFEMDNSAHDFKIGEFVNVRVFTNDMAKAIALPNSAITEINGKPAVFIKQSAEKYDLHYVVTGENNGEFTTIERGIEEGDRVVINGAYQMKMMYFNQ